SLTARVFEDANERFFKGTEEMRRKWDDGGCWREGKGRRGCTKDEL
ncbi:hypothetical protein NPIL_255281, partial [Nephila pilipes]